MADIEERAERAWRDFMAAEHRPSSDDLLKLAFVTGYLAGAGQAQRDYVAYHSRVADARAL